MNKKFTAWVLILSMLFSQMMMMNVPVQAAKSTVLVSIDNSEIVTYYGGEQGQVLEITKEYIEKMGKNTYQTYPKRGDGFQKDTPGALTTSYCEEDIGLFRQDTIMCNMEQFDAYLLKNYGTDYTGREMEGYLHYLKQNFTRCHGLVTYAGSLGEEWTDALLKTCTYNGVTYYYVTEPDVSQIGDHYLIPNQQFFRAGTLVGDYFFEIEVTWTGGTFGLPYSLEECVSYILSRIQFNFENSGECRIDPGVQTGSESPSIVTLEPANASSGEHMCSELSITFDRRIRSINLTSTNFYLMDAETGELAYKGDQSMYGLGQMTFDKSTLTWYLPSGGSHSPFQPGHTYYLVMDWGAVTFVDDSTMVITDPAVWSYTVLSSGTPKVQDASFQFISTLNGQAMEGKVDFDDRWFDLEKGGYHYSSDLAAASMALAMSTTPYVETKTTEESEEAAVDYTKSFQYAQAMLKTLGFGGISHSASYAAKEPDETAAAVFGKKKLSDGSTLVAIAVRSESNAAEWMDDLNVGSGTMNHLGFDTAKGQLLTELGSYLKAQKIKGNVAFWITGFGRGGSIANLAAATLDDGLSFDNITYEKKNVYAYTFAAPAVTTDNGAAFPIYHNIFNIINPYDLVEQIPCPQWGFQRYGEELYLPTASEGREYTSLIKTVREEYVGLTGTAEVPGTNYLSTTYFDGQKQLSEELVKMIGKLSSNREGFTELLQPILSMYIPSLLEEKLIPDYSKLLGTMVLAGVTGKKSEAASNYEMIFNQITESGSDAAYNEKASYVEKLLRGREVIRFNHSPEWILSWMRALNGTGKMEKILAYADDLNNSNYVDMLISLDAAADIEIYDACDILVAAIYNSGSTYTASGAPAEAWTLDGTKNFLLPKDGTYHMTMRAMDQDTANLNVVLMTYGKGDWVEETSYYSLLMDPNERAYNINIRPDAYSDFCSVSVRTPSGEILQESGWRSTFVGFSPAPVETTFG